MWVIGWADVRQPGAELETHWSHSAFPFNLCSSEWIFLQMN